jgi:hypothetical protein
LRSIVESYLEREGAKLRTAAERRATFERLVFKKFGARQIGDIKRSEINKLLDTIEEIGDSCHAAMSSTFSARTNLAGRLDARLGRRPVSEALRHFARIPCAFTAAYLPPG